MGFCRGRLCGLLRVKAMAHIKLGSVGFGM